MAASGKVIERLRAACLQRGVNGIRMIGRTFQNFDENGSRSLSKDEMIDGLSEYNLTMSSQEVNELFNYMDKEKSGQINFDEFLQALRPPMSRDRLNAIEAAYQKMDVDGSGQITLDDIRSTYDVTQNPDFKSGKYTADELLEEFLTSFGGVEDVITKDEFINYYSGVSASIDDDDYFCIMMNRAWNL